MTTELGGMVAKWTSDREPRWRDRGGAVHTMRPCASTLSNGRERVGWYPICGAHRETIVFKHPKYCPLPVSCVGCLGYIPTLPR